MLKTLRKTEGSCRVTHTLVKWLFANINLTLTRLCLTCAAVVGIKQLQKEVKANDCKHNTSLAEMYGCIK